MRIVKLLTYFFKSENRLHVLLNWINKTPLRALVKQVMIATNFKLWKSRRNKSLFAAVNESERDAVTSLKKYGYAHVTLLMDVDLLERVLQKSNALKADVENISKNQIIKTKDIWVRLTDQEYVSNNTTSNVFNEVALQEPMLRIAGGYLESAPYLVDSLLTFSRGTGKELKASQLWHLDYNDTKMLKLFIYLTDVEEDKYGPFMFVDKIKSAALKKPLLSSHLPDQFVYSQIGQESVIKVKKKKLNAFMVDTSRCYHAGSRLEIGEERLMLTSLYVDLPCIYPATTNNSIQDNTFNLSPLQKMAITP